MDLFRKVESTLQLVDEREPEIHALLPEPQRRERLLQEAAQLLKTWPDPSQRPPLFGELIGVKDLFNVDGLPTQAGSRIPSAAFIGAQASIVNTLKQLGALVLGKTVSTEFAYFNPGPTRNPLNPSHTPGGSSSGSAAAVASGYCKIALGTQTIASITRPASYCGVYGYKPSYGLISTAGVFPFSQTADHVGFIADSLSTIIILASALGIISKLTNTKATLGIAWVSGEYLDQADACARAAMADTLEQLKDKGHRIIELDPFGSIDAINSSHRRLISGEFARNHEALYTKYSHLYSHPSLQLYAEGIKIGKHELAKAKQEAIQRRIKLGELMISHNIDLWLTPSTTGTAPMGLESTGSPLMSLPWTNIGLPTLTIPYPKRDNHNLALGIQLVGVFPQDAKLLADAASLALD